jgi:hypothetical protein
MCGGMYVIPAEFSEKLAHMWAQQQWCGPPPIIIHGPSMVIVRRVNPAPSVPPARAAAQPAFRRAAPVPPAFPPAAVPPPPPAAPPAAPKSQRPPTPGPGAARPPTPSKRVRFAEGDDGSITTEALPLEIQNARDNLLQIQAELIKLIKQLRETRTIDSSSTRALYQQALTQADVLIKTMDAALKSHASAATTHRDEVANIRRLMQGVETLKITLKTLLLAAAATRPATPAAPPSRGGRRYDYSYNVANWWRSAAMWR